MSGDTKHELLHVLRLTNLSAMQGAKWLLRLHRKRIPADSTDFAPRRMTFFLFLTHHRCFIFLKLSGGPFNVVDVLHTPAMPNLRVISHQETVKP